jgi:2-polyprenyl-3-methyl-5-hydroxy-6-metoxy-1,4-benzoquinol methylase
MSSHPNPAPGADQRVRESLGEPAIHDRWESQYRTLANERFYDLVFDELARLVPRDRAIPTFLDAGCGIGAHSIRLAHRGFRVQAVDFSDVVAERARANVSGEGLQERISVRQADLLELPFEAEAFDHALCWGVLMHIPDVSSALAELVRVTKPGGKIVINEINAQAAEARLKRAVFTRMGTREIHVRRTPAGFEHWEETASGPLMWRHADIDWLVREASRRGLRLERRMPGQFSELYANMPRQWLADVVQGVNRVWFERVRMPGLAVANVLVFHKE